jgi:ABC-2 type transport system permease protein
MTEDKAQRQKRIINIIGKEWKSTFSNLNSALFITLLPLLITVQALIFIYLVMKFAGAIPSLLITWFCAGLFLTGIIGMGSGHLLKFVLNAQWFISLFLLVPLFSLLAFILGVIASSRANDPKTAQNIAIIVVLPILAIVGGQLIGFTVFTSARLFILSIATGVLNLFVLRVAVRLFQRESIVVRWR